MHARHLPGLALGVAHPHCGGQLRRVTDEPRVAVVLGRAGLARQRTADVGTGARAVLHDLLEREVHDPRLVPGQGPVSVGLAVIERGPAGVLDLREDLGVGLHALVGEAQIRVGHLHHRHVLGTEGQRRHRVQAGPDAQGLRGGDHLVGPDGGDELRVHGVDRVGGGVEQVQAPERLVLEVRHLPVAPAIGVRQHDLGGTEERRLGRVALVQRLGKHERLERRACLSARAPALGSNSQVDLGLVPVAAADHGHDVAVGVHGDEGTVRISVPVERLVDGVIRLLLQVLVERRLHPQAAPEDGVLAVGLHQLTAHVVDVVLGTWRGRRDRRRLGLGPLALDGDVLGFGLLG